MFYDIDGVIRWLEDRFGAAPSPAGAAEGHDVASEGAEEAEAAGEAACSA